MDQEMINRILADTAYIRTGGSEAEYRCAAYLQQRIEEIGGIAKLESFPVPMAEVAEASLFADGVEIPCKAYLCCGDADLEAPLYYLRNTDVWSLKQCAGRIVLIDGYLKYWVYQDLLKYGASGFISYNGEVHFADSDIDQRELRGYVHQGNRIPGVNIHAKDAVKLIRDGVRNVHIRIRQTETVGNSHNLILDIPGERDEYIAFTAHYDSTPLSVGAYDNMSGCIGLLQLAAHFLRSSSRYSLRFIWCGSEERGLLGSKAYCANEERLQNCVLNINLDMIGSTMGKFLCCVTAEEKLVNHASCMALEEGFGMEAWQGVYSSDSTPFADRGVPAVTFARMAPSNTTSYHSRYDTEQILMPEQILQDIGFIHKFAERMANAAQCPVSREIPQTVKDKIDIYLGRKRA